MKNYYINKFYALLLIPALTILGCSDLGSLANNSGYGTNSNSGSYDPYYRDYRYDDYRYRDEAERTRQERIRLEREREHIEDERRRLELERIRREAEHREHEHRSPNVIKFERCPSGFSPSEQKCSKEERKRGCKDMRLPSGLGCVKR